MLHCRPAAISKVRHLIALHVQPACLPSLAPSKPAFNPCCVQAAQRAHCFKPPPALATPFPPSCCSAWSPAWPLQRTPVGARRSTRQRGAAKQRWCGCCWRRRQRLPASAMAPAGCRCMRGPQQGMPQPSSCCCWQRLAQRPSLIGLVGWRCTMRRRTGTRQSCDFFFGQPPPLPL